jgi:phage repressor protein C with HTH and peptisase S24 domain
MIFSSWLIYFVAQSDTRLNMDNSEIRFNNFMSLKRQFRTQGEFAEAIDTAQAYVSQLISSQKKKNGKERKIGDDLARKIEARLKLGHGWMDNSHQIDTMFEDNAKAPVNAGKVPIISWGKIDKLESKGSMDAEKWTMTSGSHGPRAFALQVEGDSMSPEFLSGSLVVCDPDKEAVCNSFVIVKKKNNIYVFIYLFLRQKIILNIF